MSTNQTELGAAPTANTAIKLYLGAAALAGVVLIVLSAIKHWGGFGYGGGAVLIFMGVGGLVGIQKQGGFGVVVCPSCGHQGRIQFTKLHRTLQCGRCNTWLHGAEAMTVVPAHHVAAAPAYWIAVPEAAHFGDGCIACGEAATRTVAIETTRGAATAVVVGAGVLTTTTLKVPACAAHDAGTAFALENDPGAPRKVAIGFAALDAWQRFCDANQVGPAAPALHRLAPTEPVPAARVA